MKSSSHFSNSPFSKQKARKDRAKSLKSLLPPLPLFILQPLLNHIVGSVAKQHPELFDRLGDSANKIFLIDPSDLPLFLVLQPNPLNPTLKAYNQNEIIEHDTYICGTFATLMQMIDAQSDSDALFFNREIRVSGDSEAMVALRNALDDMEGSLAKDVAKSFGPLSKPVLLAMQKFSKGSGNKNE